MENISIKTTQNVSLEYSIASIGERMVANIFDLFIQFVCLLFIIIIVTKIYPQLGGWIIFFILPVMLYHILCETFLNGQSFGKMIMKVKVVKKNGTQAGFLSYLLRWIFRLIENPFVFLNGVGILTIIINGQGQRLGDIVAGTVVIRNKKSINLSDTLLLSTAEGYIPVYPDAYKLTDEEINVVREVVNLYKKDRNNEDYLNYLTLTKKKVEKKLGVSSVQHPYVFLSTILKDYSNHYSF